jgi:catechol 2,3-dioxygenase-like lactoylglutathione lyase family enzyme
MSYLGWPSPCVRVKDLEASKSFYEKLGLELISEVPDVRAIFGFGSFRLALMTFLDENLLNIRGGDVFQAFDDLKSSFPDLEGEPERYTAEQYDADADGCCWTTRDPDGNMILFDTNEREVGPEALRNRTSDILQGAAAELAAIGADPGILGKLRDDVIGPYLRSR